ncbi:MAG: TerB family tellurite resistance protein [Bacteroidales bacterium]|nr:TerB family tellurite resistance protein [Bacteroidales bacterium]
MTLNKQEFKTLVMLYAANIDGNIQSEEVKVMLQKTDFDTVEKVEKMFAKMSDMEVLACIRENKAMFAATEADRLDLIHDLCAIIEADEKVSVMEEQMVRVMRRVLE